MSSKSALEWLLEDFTKKTPGVQCAVLGSLDGLSIAYGTAESVEAAEKAAAIASQLFLIGGQIVSLTDQEGSVQQVCVERTDGNFFVMSAGDNMPSDVRTPLATVPGAVGMLLAVLADRDADPRQVGWAMGNLIRSVSDHLVVATRHSSTPSSDGQ